MTDREKSIAAASIAREREKIIAAAFIARENGMTDDEISVLFDGISAYVVNELTTSLSRFLGMSPKEQ